MRLPVTRTLALGFLILAAGAIVGAVFALTRSDSGPAAADVPAVPTAVNADAYRTERFPDGRIDVCVWAFRDAKAPDGANVQAVVQWLDGSPGGSAIGLNKAGERAVIDCADKPAQDFVFKRENVQEAQSEFVFTPAGGAIPEGQQPAYDLYLFVYPQDVADSVGVAWGDRVKTYQVRNEGGVVTGGTVAVLIGEAEARDSAMLRRLVARGLGLAGTPNDLRPFIDNECVKPGDPECGPDYFAAN